MLLMAGLLIAPVELGAQSGYEARPESKVWIKGTSTVHDFDCTSDKISGNAKVTQTAVDDTVEADSQLDIEIIFPVKQFDCGRSRMNRDFYETLEAENHEAITFDFISAQKTDNPTDEYDLYQVVGILNVAGVEREVTVEVKGTRTDDGAIRITGVHPISMKDFDIEPPTALMGMIQVHDELEVHFELLVDSN